MASSLLITVNFSHRFDALDMLPYHYYIVVDIPDVFDVSKKHFLLVLQLGENRTPHFIGATVVQVGCDDKTAPFLTTRLIITLCVCASSCHISLAYGTSQHAPKAHRIIN